MLRGLYSAATALDTASANHEVVSENLAHATAPGFRQRGLGFETFDAALDKAASGAKGLLQGTRKGKTAHDFTPGDIHFTGAKFDVALSGDAFFTVEGPNGPLYTRNGVFELGPDGTLQTKSGLPVSGGGRITVPQGAADVLITREGAVIADGQEVGRLALARFADPKQLTPVGTTLFAAPPGVSPETPTNVTVQQGYRESSNVNVVNTLVSMIAGMRHYEAAHKAMRAMSDAVEQRTRPDGV